MKSIKLLFTALVFLSFTSCNNAKKKDKAPAKNIIFLIGDGMGLTQIQAAMTANGNYLNFERFKVVGLSKTSSSDSYITDSASGATAFSAGNKTYNGAIGVDSLKQPVITILEDAEAKGLATGLVSTSQITHATPASFIAHDTSRNNYEAIAFDFLDVDIDVFIGGGYNHFAKRRDSLDLLKRLKDDSYQIALTNAEMDSVHTGKLAALLAPVAMPTMTAGRGDMLQKATEKSLELLSQNEKGFFLMVEGSQIDWGGHANNTEYMVTELLDFDMAVAAALDFAEKDGETLVLITADHETGGLTLLGENILGDSTATAYSTGGHTPVMVPVFAFGPGAKTFGGIYENTAIYGKMMRALGLAERKQ